MCILMSSVAMHVSSNKKKYVDFCRLSAPTSILNCRTKVLRTNKNSPTNIALKSARAHSSLSPARSKGLRTDADAPSRLGARALVTNIFQLCNETSMQAANCSTSAGSVRQVDRQEEGKRVCVRRALDRPTAESPVGSLAMTQHAALVPQSSGRVGLGFLQHRGNPPQWAATERWLS